MRSNTDLAGPHRIKDAEVVSVQSAASPPMPNPDASTEGAYEALAQSAANLAMARRDNLIDEAMSQLVNQLAAFCLEKVEQISTNEDDDDIDISVEELEEEHRV